jgi:hypothetical protein
MSRLKAAGATSVLFWFSEFVVFLMLHACWHHRSYYPPHGRQDCYAANACALVPFCCRHPLRLLAKTPEADFDRRIGQTLVSPPA